MSRSDEFSLTHDEQIASLRRKLDIKKLDNADRFQWLVVTVAGAGFFVDGYLVRSTS